jgi:hypothetical protein
MGRVYKGDAEMIKYELVKEESFLVELEDGTCKSYTMYRIRALRDFGDVKKGDLGGFIESEKNLSHSGNCWIYDGSYGFGNSRITGNAKIKNYSEIGGNCRVGGNSTLSGVDLDFGVIK